MAGYRVVAGYGRLKRNLGESAADLPTKSNAGTTTVVAPHLHQRSSKVLLHTSMVVQPNGRDLVAE